MRNRQILIRIPALKMAFMEGRVALILVGSFTFPSLRGTLKSTLMRTLLPKEKG